MATSLNVQTQQRGADLTTSLKSSTTTTTSHGHHHQHQQKERNNVWGSLLKQQKIDPKLQEGIEDSYSVVFLGDAKNGQRSLVRRFQGKEISGDVYNDTLSIEYTFFKAIDSSKHQQQQQDDFSSGESTFRNDRDKYLNIYQMENQYFSYLLDFAINPSTFDKTVVVITVDISNTKNIISRTKKWIRILQDHINQKIIPELKEDGMQKCYERVKSIFRKGEQQSATSDHHPNDITVIDTNLGIPIVIAITKSDLAEKIADSFCTKKSIINIIPHHFLNFISFKLRKLCHRCMYLNNVILVGLFNTAFKDGASLFYTSSSSNINCLLLKKYIMNICYNTPFDYVESVESRDHTGIVIPSGCDTAHKVKSIDCSTVTSDPEGVDFETLISDFDMASHSDRTIDVPEPFEDFEMFLKKQQKVRNMMQRTTSDGDATPLLSPSSMSSPIRTYTNRTGSSAGKGNQTTPRAKYDLSPRSSSMMTPPPPPLLSSPGSAENLCRNDSSENVMGLKSSTTPGGGSTTSDQVENAEHFFHQLLQRYSSKSPHQTPSTKQ